MRNLFKLSLNFNQGEPLSSFAVTVKLRIAVVISARVNESHSIGHSRLRRRLLNLSPLPKCRSTQRVNTLRWFANHPWQRNLVDVRRASNYPKKTRHRTSQLPMESHLVLLSVAEDRRRTLLLHEVRACVEQFSLIFRLL